MKEIRIRVTFIEDLLGTLPGDPEIFSTYVAQRSPDATTVEEEIAAIGIEEYSEKAITVFPRTDAGEPFIYDYQWKGYFKEKCSYLKKLSDTSSSKIKAFKKEIDGLIFIKERRSIIKLSDAMSLCQRPLRASTPQGERISLTCSEAVPSGSTNEFTVVCMVDKDVELVKEWLDFGRWSGTGQWRNSGKGRFLWEELDTDGNVIGGNKDIE